MSLVTNDDHQAIKCSLSGMSTEMYCYPLITHRNTTTLTQSSATSVYFDMIQTHVQIKNCTYNIWRLGDKDCLQQKTHTELASHLLWFGFVISLASWTIVQANAFPYSPPHVFRLARLKQSCKHKKHLTTSTTTGCTVWNTSRTVSCAIFDCLASSISSQSEAS